MIIASKRKNNQGVHNLCNDKIIIISIKQKNNQRTMLFLQVVTLTIIWTLDTVPLWRGIMGVK